MIGFTNWPGGVKPCGSCARHIGVQLLGAPRTGCPQVVERECIDACRLQPQHLELVPDLSEPQPLHLELDLLRGPLQGV